MDWITDKLYWIGYDDYLSIINITIGVIDLKTNIHKTIITTSSLNSRVNNLMGSMHVIVDPLHRLVNNILTVIGFTFGYTHVIECIWLICKSAQLLSNASHAYYSW